VRAKSAINPLETINGH